MKAAIVVAAWLPLAIVVAVAFGAVCRHGSEDRTKKPGKGTKFK